MHADLTPYRRFPGNAAEAMEFYRSLFGAELQTMTYDQIHSAEEVGDQGDKIMHAELIVDGRKLLFAADIPPGMETTHGEDTPLSLTGGPAEEAELRGYWEKLAEGADITMPLAAVPWGATYGALQDRFGTHWMFNIAGQ